MAAADFSSTVLTYAPLLRPMSLIGTIAWAVMFLSFYFVIWRRDPNNALFVLCLGWHLLLLDVVRFIPAWLDNVSYWGGVASMASKCELLLAAVVPALITVPALSLIVSLDEGKALRRRAGQVAATVVGLLDATTIILLLAWLLWGH